MDYKPTILNFITDAQTFIIHLKIKNKIPGNYPHIGITAREGIHILYRLLNTKQWYNIDACSSRNSPITVNMKQIIGKNEKYEIMIYGPILSEIEELNIDIPPKSNIEYITKNSKRTFLIVGGMHTFGIGCTACGVMFPNILGRKYEANIHNISYNENNYLKFIYDYFNKNNHPKVDLGILELDYINQNEKIFDDYAGKVIKQMKKKSKHLICWFSIPLTEKRRQKKIKTFSKKYTDDENISIINLSYLYNEKHSEMCTHSKNYINDTGNIMIYKSLNKNIKKLNEEEYGIFKINK